MIQYLLQLLLFVLTSTALHSQDSSLSSFQPLFDGELKPWTKSFKNFKLSEFNYEGIQKWEDQPFADTKDLTSFYALYKPFLSFSKDSGKFIDMYSYWLNLHWVGKKKKAELEIDQAISFCEIANKKWKRILFCGMSTRIDEAVWVSNRTFLLVGTIAGDSTDFHPVIYIGDTVSRQFSTFQNIKCKSINSDYRPSKLNKLKFDDE